LAEIFYRTDVAAAKQIAQKLGLDEKEFVEGFVFEILQDDEVFGLVAYSDYREDDSVWISICTWNKKWCTAKVLKQIFGVAFNALKCRRINALICADNKASLSLAERCGFVKEGKMRAYYSDGKDAFVLGMLREDCKFIK